MILFYLGGSTTLLQRGCQTSPEGLGLTTSWTWGSLITVLQPLFLCPHQRLYCPRGPVPGLQCPDICMSSAGQINTFISQTSVSRCSLWITSISIIWGNYLKGPFPQPHCKLTKYKFLWMWPRNPQWTSQLILLHIDIWESYRYLSLPRLVVSLGAHTQKLVLAWEERRWEVFPCQKKVRQRFSQFGHRINWNSGHPVPEERRRGQDKGLGDLESPGSSVTGPLGHLG